MENKSGKDLTKKLIEMGYRYGIHEVYVDFLELSALAISNRFDLRHYDAREQRYLDIVRKYTAADMEAYADMLAVLITALQDEAATGKLNDVLGAVYHDLGLHNKWKGQFFTPQPICDMMGYMTLGADRKPGRRTVLEPCVGSGAMVLGFVNAMIDRKLNYTHNLEVTAIDSDLKCVHMAFLQFSFYGIPATVIHGNSLTNEHWSVWRTPMFFIRL